MHRKIRAVASFALFAISGALLQSVGNAAPNSAPAFLAEQPNILDPHKAPVIRIKVTAAKHKAVARQSGGQTVLSASAIENKPGVTSFTQVIAASVPGTAAAPDGEVHIRGSHGQYSYFLDGSPLPSNVTGSFSDLINPKNIETLRVYTGGFPAEYGGQLAAIFDVTTKSGQVGRPGGFIQQLAEGYETDQTTAQFGGTEQKLSYFGSGVRMSTGSFISPVTQNPMHDAGNESVGFGKIDYQAGPHDRITWDTSVNSAHVEIPNTAQQSAIGVSDDQLESGYFNNLIWRRTNGGALSRVVIYSHTSRLDYRGSVADLLSNPGEPILSIDNIGNDRTDENQTAHYIGLRYDQVTPAALRHRVQYGFDVDYVNVDQNFRITSVVNTGTAQNPVAALATASQVGTVFGGDRGFYLQDDYTPGRLHLNYGARYDQHNADTTTSQWSPRVNFDYTAGKRDSFRLYYDRLFQPASIEDVKNLNQNAITTGITSGGIVPFKPERDNFYQGGWTHRFGSTSADFNAYYRDELNTIDDAVIGNSQIDIPINFSKGYTRGLELSLDGDVTKTISYYANIARSWAQEAGPITGGLLNQAQTPGYIYDDHDQTYSGAIGVDYEHHGHFASMDGEYGSGFPYYVGPNQNILQWTSPHLIVDTAIGTQIGLAQFAFTVDNALNHAYIIKEAGPFTNTQWALGRQYGLKLTQNF